MSDAILKPPPAPPPAAHKDDDEVAERRTLRDYYIILRERLWIALPLAVLIALGYGYNQLRQEPRYRAFATLQFEKPDSGQVVGQRIYDPGVQSEYDINTYIQILNSDKLRSRVMESFKPDELAILRRAELKRAPPGTPPTAIGINLGGVSPEPVRGSFLIRINVNHDDPDAAMIVANHYLDSFTDYVFDSVSGRNDTALDYLNKQADRLRLESEAADKKLNDYMKEKQLLSLDASQNTISENLRKANTNKFEAYLRVLEMQNQVKQIREFKAQGKNLLEIPAIAAVGELAALRVRLNDLKREQDELTQRYYELHPRMLALTNNLVTTQEQFDKALDTAIRQVETRLSEAEQQHRTFQSEVEKLEKDQLRLNDLNVEFSSLKREAAAASGNYTTVLASLTQTRTTKYYDKIPIRPLDRAKRGYQYAPDRASITRTSIGIGVLVFLGVAIGLSFIDDRIKSAWDVESFVGANLLGIIPDLASMKDEDKYTLLLDNQQAPGVEAFLSVYSSIKIHSKLDFPKSLLVTSTIPGEGKTLISCNVAGAFARHGKRTLIVDCDLRRPMLHRHFKQQNNAGLITWFEGGSPLEGDLGNNPTLGIIKISENLSLLCSGGRSKSPTELLENPVFGQLLERLKKEYDLVIIDSPPLGAVTDSLLIAERVDEVVYVCRFNRAYRKHIRLFMRALRNGKNEVLGVVLNGLSPRRIEYYSNYRYYRSYKKYYGAQT